MTAQLFASTLRVSTPLIFAALGGMFAERSGVINIALEGMMLIGAFGAAVGTLMGHSPWLGAVAGMAGATLSIFLSSSFSRNMTAGRGFMALAALIFGKWKPLPTALACLLFGFSDAVQIRLQGVGSIPVQFIQILPYVVTIF